MPGSPSYFACPSCGNRKLWKAELAGKRGKCACGHILTVPVEAPVAADDDDTGELQLAPAPAPVRPVRRTPIPPAHASVVVEREESDGSVTTVAAPPPSTRIQVDPTKLMGHKRLAREKAADDTFRFSMIRDGVLPAVLIAAGIALCLAAGSYQGDQRWLGMERVAGPVTLNIVTGLALVIGAVFAASAMGGVSFREPVGLVMYKLCAIALAPGALGQLSQAWIGGFNGDMAAVFVSLGCYAALFMILFKMAAADRVACVALIFIIRAAVTYMIFRLQGAKNALEI